MSKKTFIAILLLGLVFSWLVYAYPLIDIYVSSLFYEPYEGFLLRAHKYKIVGLFRHGIIYLSYVIVTTMVLLCIIRVFRPKFNAPIATKSAVFIILSFLIVPIFLVDFTLKEHWGRARPYQTTEFSGSSQFSKAFVISDQCQSNCSFISGEAANAFAYLAFIFLATRRRKLVATCVLTMACLVGLMRMAQGGHFLSDVVLSAWLDYLVIWILYQRMIYTSAS